MEDLGFPLWVRITHFFNFLFMSLLIRSGIEILSAHPKLYWNNSCGPGSEWLNFMNKSLPEGRLWTAEDEVRPMNSVLALPGKENLGLGRHWHFWSVVGWLITGFVYVGIMLFSPQWNRLIPDSWEILPKAWQTFATYLSFELPHQATPLNPLQQLTYFLLVFVLTPLVVITGVMMAPAISARYTRLSRLFGGKQGARSLHFIGMVLYLLFFLIHLIMVFAHGFGKEMAKIVLGSEHAPKDTAIAIGLTGIALVLLVNILATKASLKAPFKTKKFLEAGIDSLLKFLFHHQVSVQKHQKISPVPRANGRPPQNREYQAHLQKGFSHYSLKVYGMVENPLELGLEDLKSMPKKSQTTLHHCIQGWSYYAQWAGTPIKILLEKCKPLPKAKYLVFHTLDEKWEKLEVNNGYYYEVIDLELALKPQSILAYEMNHQPLPINNGAPLRLRLETQLGYKMAKWVCAIELVEDFRHIGKGQGGWRDDVLHYYVNTAGI